MTDEMMMVIILVVGLFLGFLIGTLYWIPKFEDYQRKFNAELSAIKVRLKIIRNKVDTTQNEPITKEDRELIE